MGWFDDYFQPAPSEGDGLPSWLESLQHQQAYQPGGGLGGWLQPGPAVQQTPVSQPTPHPLGNVPIPGPRPDDMPLGSIAIGNYLMPQFGAAQVSQSPKMQSDLGDRLGAGFRSWAYTPVGNPFAALANAITGFTTGQFTAGPPPTAPDPRSRLLAQSLEGGTNVVPAGPATGVQPFPRTLMRRGLVPRR